MANRFAPKPPNPLPTPLNRRTPQTTWGWFSGVGSRGAVWLRRAYAVVGKVRTCPSTRASFRPNQGNLELVDAGFPRFFRTR